MLFGVSNVCSAFNARVCVVRGGLIRHNTEFVYFGGGLIRDNTDSGGGVGGKHGGNRVKSHGPFQPVSFNAGFGFIFATVVRANSILGVGCQHCVRKIWGNGVGETNCG